MILVPFVSARAFVALGSWLVMKVPNTLAVEGCYDMDLLLTAMGVEKKEESSDRALFIVDTT